MKSIALLATFLFTLVAPRPVIAQAEPVDEFVRRVAQLWGAGDAAGLIALIPADGRIVLDTGNGTQTVNAGHASAALRALFNDRETTAVRPLGVTLAGGSPARAFAEIAWSFRNRAAPALQTRSVYVGVVQSGNGWRVRELRVIPEEG